MQDRVSLHPGRVKLVPVAGQENTYDMVRADEPTQDGTPLNKDSLLKDATAALYGLGADAVPDDVLALLKTLVDNAQHSADRNSRIVVGTYIGTGTYGASNPCSLTFDFTPEYIAILAASRNTTGGNTVGAEDLNSIVFPTVPTSYTSGYGILARSGSSVSLSDCYGKRSGNTFSWYCIKSNGSISDWVIAQSQANEAGITYVYVAMG